MTLEQIWHFTKWGIYKLRWPLMIGLAFIVTTQALGLLWGG